MSWTVSSGGRQIAKVESPFESGMFRAKIAYESGQTQVLYYNPSDTTWGKKLADRLSFKLFENAEAIGFMVGRTKKTGFLRAIAYYEFVYYNDTYSVYEVGLGKNGLFLCFYRGEQIVAIVEKELRVVNYRDKYTAYMLDDALFCQVLPFVIYYDVTAYGDVMEHSVYSVKEKRVYTKQKELIEKFDRSFIDAVKKTETEGRNDSCQ